MSSNPCRDGVMCQRADCWFAHPPGRALGGGGGGGYAAPRRGYGGAPPQQQQYYPPQQQAQRGGAPANPGNVCRFGRSCHRDNCYYAHPDGREVDDGLAPVGGISAGPGASAAAARGGGGRGANSSPSNDFNPEDWEEAKDEEDEAAAYAAIEQCECCGGKPFECQTRACKEVGRCGCMMGENNDDEETDDSWRDEWFPASRNCPCCAGSIYRCQKQQDDCVSGNCFCSLTKQ